MTTEELDKLQYDTALSLFGAVSVILSNTQLNVEDRKYLIEQLAVHYVNYYRYFDYLFEHGSAYTLNRISLKAKTAKNNIERYFVCSADSNASRTLNQLFPK